MSGERSKLVLPLSLVINIHPKFVLATALADAFILGCCPLLRPVIRRIFPDLFPSAAVSGQPNSRPSNAIKLATISNTDKAREADESSSTHQLADSEHDQLDDYMHDEVSTGIYTIISSEANDWGSSGREEGLDLTSIHVRQGDSG